MKTLLLIIALCVAVPMATTSCTIAPSARVVQARTLGILGTTAKTGMDGATQLLKQGRISVDQWRNVANFYDLRWQPAFNLAVAAVRADLSSIASPDLQKLADEFAALLGTFSTPPR